MTISATTPQRNATGAYGHRHTKSGSAINVAPLTHQKVKLHHTTHQIQSPPPRDAASRTSKPDNSPPKKRRRPRKPKELQRQPSPSSNASESAGNISSGSVTKATPEPSSTALSSPKTPTKSMDSTGKVYAGPGFHHSPAPSALPVPKFFSKSVPSNRSPGLQAMMEEEYDNTDDSTTSSPPSEGPLEQLFRAHRKELAERRSDTASDSDSMPDTPARDIFGMDPDSPVRPTFKTNRNNAGRMGVQRTVTDNPVSSSPLFSRPMNSPAQSAPSPATPSDSERLAQSAALKQFLFQRPGNAAPLSPSPIGRSQASPQVSPLLKRSHAPQQNFGNPTTPRGPPFHVREYAQPRSPTVYQDYSPIRPQFSTIVNQWRSSEQCRAETNEMTAMENSLRQALKLDPRPARVEGVAI